MNQKRLLKYHRQLIVLVLLRQLDLSLMFVLLTQVVSILDYQLLVVLLLQDRLKEFLLRIQELNMLLVFTTLFLLEVMVKVD